VQKYIFQKFGAYFEAVLYNHNIYNLSAFACRCGCVLWVCGCSGACVEMGAWSWGRGANSLDLIKTLESNSSACLSVLWRFRSKVSIEDGLLLSLDCVHVFFRECMSLWAWSGRGHRKSHTPRGPRIHFDLH